MHQLERDKLARQYAQALLDEAKQQGVVDSVLHHLYEMQRWFTDAPELLTYFESPRVLLADKVAFVQDHLIQELPALNQRLLQVLVESNRVGLLPAVFHQARTLWETECGVATLQVSSAIPLAEAFQHQLREALQRALGLNYVHLDCSVNPDLIGGLVVRQGDVVLDASLEGRLARLERQLVTTT